MRNEADEVLHGFGEKLSWHSDEAIDHLLSLGPLILGDGAVAQFAVGTFAADRRAMSLFGETAKFLLGATSAWMWSDPHGVVTVLALVRKRLAH